MLVGAVPDTPNHMTQITDSHRRPVAVGRPGPLWYTRLGDELRRDRPRRPSSTAFRPALKWGATGMTSGSTRRHFLEMTGATVGMAGLGWRVAIRPARGGRDRDAAGSGCPAEGRGAGLGVSLPLARLSHRRPVPRRLRRSTTAAASTGPTFEVASLFIEQTPTATDLGRAKARTARRPPQPDDRRRADAGHGQAGRRRRPADRRARRLSATTRSSRSSIREGGSSAKSSTSSGRRAARSRSSSTSTCRTTGPRPRRDGRSAQALKRPADGRVEPAGDLAAARARGPARPDMERGRRRVAGRHRDLRVPRPGDAPVHGRAPRPTRQAPGGRRRDLPGGRRRLGGRRRGRWSRRAARRTPSAGATPLNPGDIRQNTRDFRPPARRTTSDQVPAARSPSSSSMSTASAGRP